MVYSGTQLVYPTKSIGDIAAATSAPILPLNITKSIQDKGVPPRAQLTLWFANLGRLKTGDLLVDKGIIDAHHALCPFCRLVLESNSHILFTCQFSWGAWMMIFDWSGIRGVLHSRYEDFVIHWRGLWVGRKWKRLCKLILSCMIWSIWYERNKAKFEATTHDLHKFAYVLKIRIGIQAKEILGMVGFSPQDFTNNLKAVLL